MHGIRIRKRTLNFYCRRPGRTPKRLFYIVFFSSSVGLFNFFSSNTLFSFDKNENEFDNILAKILKFWF